jgi:hypothetical protein
MRSAPLALACLALLALAPASAAAAGHNWTRFGVNAARSNSSSAVAGIAAGDLATLKRRDIPVPGLVDSSPVYLHDALVKGAKRDVYIVTTTYGRTLALGAVKGTVLWNFSPPVADELNGTKWWTNASPVADPKRGFVYTATPDGMIHKLRIEDGAEVTTGAWPTAVTLDFRHEKLSASLNLSHGYVIATTAGYAGDVPPYQGHVALIRRDEGGIASVFNSLCARRRVLMDPTTCKWTDSGIWGRSGAVVVPKTNRILAATGNGNWNGATNWGDTVLKLSPDASKLEDYWTPTNQSALDHFDFDLGSTSPALLRDGKRWLAVQGGKDTILRLLDVDNLNGRGRFCQCLGGELQILKVPGHLGFLTALASWRNNGKSWLIVAKNGWTGAYRLDGSPPKLQLKWSHEQSGTSPVIAGGLVYVYDPEGTGVKVYRPTSGKLVGTLPAARGHWSSPVVADGRVALGFGDANDRQTTGVFAIYSK